MSKKPKKSDLDALKKVLGNVKDFDPIAGLMMRPPKRRRTWQIGFLGLLAQDGSLLEARVKVGEMPSPFYGTGLYLSDRFVVVTAILVNKVPVTDHMGRPIDEAFFRRWRLPAAVPGPDLPLRDNGIRLVLQNGDEVEIAAKWDGLGRKVPEWSASLVGIVEDET